MPAAEMAPETETEVELARLAAIVSSSDDAIVSKDLNGIVNSWNAAAERIFGYSAEEMIGRPITTIIPEDLRHEEAEIIGKIRRGVRIEHYDTVRMKKDGTRFDVSLTVSPLKNSRGVIVGASKIARDISERKHHEQLQSVLIHELNHRTKNLLATVQAIVTQTFHDVMPARMQLFRDRVQALATSQDLLTKNGWKGAPLSAMITAVLAPFTSQDGRISVALGPDVQLSLRQTNALSLAFHELATNALKYGALSVPSGHVNIQWQVQDNELALTWKETGGPAVSPPTRNGFGTQVLKFALEHELKATVDVDYDMNGLRFAAVIPVSSNRIAAERYGT